MAYTQEDIRSKLLQIYALSNLADITDVLITSTFTGKVQSHEEVVKIKEELAKEELYLNIKDQLTDFKKLIDKKINNKNIVDPEQQVKTVLYNVVLDQAISLSYGEELNHRSYKMKLLFDLIKGQFITTGKWNKKLSDHFYFVFPVLRDWYSLFFSYTNKNAAFINQKYKSILPIDATSESNQVARYVARRLHDKLIPDGFVDEKEIEYGEPFQQTIETAIKKSYTFVQIISPESFSKIGKKNWCEYEYSKYQEFLKETKTNNEFYYLNALQHNLFFLVMGHNLESVKPALVLDEYSDWFDEIESTHHLRFYAAEENPANPLEPKSTIVNFENSIDQLVMAIFKAKKKLIDSIPG